MRGTVLPPNIPCRAGAHYLVLPTSAGSIFMPWFTEAVIYLDTAQHLYPPRDRTPASHAEGGNDDHTVHYNIGTRISSYGNVFHLKYEQKTKY